ncbi:MAG: nitrogen fixation protein NifM [Gammaproteobacteria bacterium]|nr:nitrogen fixation protein NifM [Gammaproteobacteria bacterium]
MMYATRQEAAGDQGYNYHLLKAALNTFQCNLGQLEPAQLTRARQIADKSFEIESLVIASPEARDVFIADSEVARAVDEIEAKYADHDEFVTDLAGNQLDEETLRASLRRELLFDSVMRRVGARSPAVNDLDVRLFYELHIDRFTVPERRTARHILITVNPDYVENTAAAARARIQQLADKLRTSPRRFAKLARHHSECPTALDGGKLGSLHRGKLYPQLDAALFRLREGEVSEVVESEVGLHLLLCERIEAGRKVPLSKARTRIVEILQQRKQRNCQKAWLGELRRAASLTKVS